MLSTLTDGGPPPISSQPPSDRPPPPHQPAQVSSPMQCNSPLNQAQSMNFKAALAEAATTTQPTAVQWTFVAPMTWNLSPSKGNQLSRSLQLSRKDSANHGREP
ncbi:unnamed protein product [Linum trigynum]|uniref:Uncharacterized protein n=1 Tax=Linum trigynum TaxID=586398 RepID=A0AAV2DNQ2_9ROSI